MAINSAELIEYLFELARPIKLEAPWNFLEVDPDSRVASFKPELFGELKNRFDTSTLRRARVVVTRQEVEVLNPLLTRPNQTLILLRNRDKQPIDILTEQGCLRNPVPLFAAYHAARCSNARNSNQVFVPFAARDLVILRSLGLTAAPACWLDRLRPDGLQQLLYRTGGDSNGPIPRFPVKGYPQLLEDGCWLGKPENEPPSFEVTFCAFSLARLELDVPAGLAPVAEHLTGAQDHLKIYWEGLHVWHPRREIEKLKYLVGLRSSKMIAEVVLKRKELYGLKQFTVGSQPPRQQNSLVQSLQIYERSLGRYRRQDTGNDLQALHDAEKDYRQQIDTLIFEPQLEAALATPDLNMISLLILRAHLLRNVLSVVPRMHDESVQFAEQRREDLLPPEMVRQLESMTKMICKVDKPISDRSSEGGDNG